MTHRYYLPRFMAGGTLALACYLAHLGCPATLEAASISAVFGGYLGGLAYAYAVAFGVVEVAE